MRTLKKRSRSSIMICTAEAPRGREQHEREDAYERALLRRADGGGDGAAERIR